MIDERAFRLISRIKAAKAASFTSLKSTVPHSKTLASKLKMLEALGLVLHKDGRYSLTPPGEEALGALERYVLATRKGPQLTNLDRIPHAGLAPVIKKYCEALLKEYGESLVGLVLFGSVATGRWAKDSDVDLLVVREGWERKRTWERADELGKLKLELASTAEYAEAVRRGHWPIIQNVPLAPGELSRMSAFLLDVAFDGIVLFDRDGTVARFLKAAKGWGEREGVRREVLPDGTRSWVFGEPHVVR